MKHFFLLFMATCVLLPFDGYAKMSQASQLFCFTENKGQLHNQNGQPRNDIQFTLHTQGLDVFIGSGQLHYQFSQPEAAYNWKKEKQSSKIVLHRIDVTLAGANKKAVAAIKEQQQYYENYYLPGCVAAGIQAHTCKRIVYRNIYKNIDWAIFTKNEHLEQEFIIRQGGNPADIQIRYSGQASLKLNNDGSIAAVTSAGIIKENAPLCYKPNGEKIKSAYILHGNTVGYKVNANGPMVIDPGVEWATYYGPDTSSSPVYGIASDDSANVYIAGLTFAAGDIATTGAFYDVIGGDADAYLVKFDSLGNRIWATYYGGSKDDWASAIVCDHNNNIYIGGSTASSTGISTPGSQEPAYIAGGLWVGFMAKFNAAGERIWGTYVGGTGGVNFDLEIASLCRDNLGHIYVSGSTDDTTNITTSGAFKHRKTEGRDTTDCFLIQYDTAGVRQWGTYYGGHGNEFGGVSCTDGQNVYLSGFTASDTGIASASSYQTSLRGSTDDFLVKFDSKGNRVWATYYGGEAQETMGGIFCGKSGGIYLFGGTSSNNYISSPGCFQAARAGGNDAFLVKFETELGFRKWATYYGGPDDETVVNSRITTDDSDNVYITGYTASTTGIASSSAWQPVFGGGDVDAFFAKFDGSGNRLWSTYYGGEGTDYGTACAFDGENIYLCGQTNSMHHIGTYNGFMPTGGDTGYNYQGFLAKFSYTNIVAASEPLIKHAKADIHIYPIPNNGTFTIYGVLNSQYNSALTTITNMTGKVIMETSIPVNNGSVDQQIKLNSGAPAGEYFLQLISGGQLTVLKFLKE